MRTTDATLLFGSTSNGGAHTSSIQPAAQYDLLDV